MAAPASGVADQCPGHRRVSACHDWPEGGDHDMAVEQHEVNADRLDRRAADAQRNADYHRQQRRSST